MSDLYIADDNKPRCKWCGFAPEFPDYHDNEWGFPVDNDIRLFEKLCLEGFQSGLSWRTILVKRENFRKAFDGFDFNIIAKYGESDVERLVNDAGIVRHRGKIEAVINNANRAHEIIAEFGTLAKYFWAYEPDLEALTTPQTQSTSDVSVKISKDLKKRGWKFVGPTTIFAFMQATGLINDHSYGCFVRDDVAKARADFSKP